MTSSYLSASDAAIDDTISTAHAREDAQKGTDALAALLAKHHRNRETFARPAETHYVRTIHAPGYVPSASSSSYY